MARVSFKSVDDYLAAQPDDVRPLLARLRATIRKAVPGADEVIAYQMPTYKLPGGAVIYFAAWKAHLSIYPASAGVVAAFKTDLSPYEVEKGTIRFSLDAPLPLRLIGRIAKLRAHEVAARAQAKPAAAKRKPPPPRGRAVTAR